MCEVADKGGGEKKGCGWGRVPPARRFYAQNSARCVRAPRAPNARTRLHTRRAPRFEARFPRRRDLAPPPQPPACRTPHYGTLLICNSPLAPSDHLAAAHQPCVLAVLAPALF